MNIRSIEKRLRKMEQKLRRSADNGFTLMELCRAMWDHDKKEFIELAQTTGLTVAVSRLEAEDAERERTRQRSAGR